MTSEITFSSRVGTKCCYRRQSFRFLWRSFAQYTNKKLLIKLRQFHLFVFRFLSSSLSFYLPLRVKKRKKKSPRRQGVSENKYMHNTADYERKEFHSDDEKKKYILHKQPSQC